MTKMRSPNFPTIALSQAVGLTDKIFRLDRTNAIEKEDAAKHMGYTGLTGRTLKLLGALSQYGLIDKVAKGQVKVSQTAVSILHPGDDKERLEALARAGRSPALFKRLRDAYPDEPSERTIMSFLVREGFTDSAIPSVLKSYRETNRFLAGAGVSESYGNDVPDVADSSSELEEDEQMSEATPVNVPAKQEANERRYVAPVSDGPLDFDVSSGRLTIMGGTISPKEAAAFLPKLKAAIEFFGVVAKEPTVEDNGDDV
jgi:hypothetical protein